jgi:hypothetical protein
MTQDAGNLQLVFSDCMPLPATLPLFAFGPRWLRSVRLAQEAEGAGGSKLNWEVVTNVTIGIPALL